jgi:signal transduction histidine kinase
VKNLDPLLDSAPCGFLVVGDDGTIRLANSTAAEMLGAADAPALIGRHVDFILSTPSRIFYQTHVFPTLCLQGKVQEVYVALIGSGGAEVPVLLNAKRRTDGDHKVSDWALVPMRQRNELENEILKARRVADESSKAKDQFLALVSHELRSPLTAILNWATLLLQREPDAATLKRGLQAIDRNARVQSRLVDDILDEVRVQTGKLRLELADVDARPILSNVLDGVAPAARAKSVELEGDLSTEQLLVRADPNRLQQVFWNVVHNAVKFTPAGGRVRATMRPRDAWVEAAISDTGHGISPEFLPHVFEHFRQEHAASSGAEGGLGLGMAITRTLVELHGGSISASSSGLGHGSTFIVRLPTLQRPPVGAAAHPDAHLV